MKRSEKQPIAKLSVVPCCRNLLQQRINGLLLICAMNMNTGYRQNSMSMKTVGEGELMLCGVEMDDNVAGIACVHGYISLLIESMAVET